MALAAQGFGRRRPSDGVATRDLTRCIQRLGQFQIDSINVVTRAHYLPMFSRYGPYDTTMLDRAAHQPPRRLFEYWGHAASLIDVELEPYLRFRMSEGFRDVWSGVEQVARANPDLVAHVRDAVAARGPVSARQLEVAEVRDRTGWGWNWSAVKTVLEWLFYCGEVTSVRRNTQFERVYDVPERVLPARVLAVPTPSPEDAVLELVRRAARALGVASERCLRDYFRTRPAMTRQAIATLVDRGELAPVTVTGWDRPAYLWHQATVPRSLTARALLSPFDSLVFERARLEALFDFHYRIEIYVPAERRQFGYYVYPFLLDDAIVARVDLKADRARGTLRVNSAWLEPGSDPAYVAAELAAELTSMARWQGLAGLEVLPRGDLAVGLGVAASR